MTTNFDWKQEEASAAMESYLLGAVANTTVTDKNVQGDGQQGLSKSALKKLAKGKKKDKVKPQWGDGSKKKDKEKKAAKAPKEEFVFVNTTPKGEKKDMNATPMADAYFPSAVESAWQEWWEAKGFYSCDPKDALGKKADEDKFVMVIPPPNVTGSLHLGHALTAAVEDTLTRWHRMQGHATLYVPGTDHAGIATQSVVEKMMMKESGQTRHDLGREKFIEKVWEWKEEYGNKITTQLRSLGSSVDWSRERFTMDSMCNKAVIEAFNQLHEKGLLYRDMRLGNWSCALKSAISDIEVDYIDLEGRTYLEVKTHKGNPNDKQGRYEFGVLTSFAYPVENSDEKIVVATTRLETMLGDTAVAVHPDDPRYKHLHGKFLIHPFNGRRIPIVTDGVLVDMSFGTGAVKITPAHDPNDYECGKRHNLEFITVLTPDGAINHNGSQFEGMMRYDARIAVEEALKEKGLYIGKEPNKMRLGICSRSGDILEPMITPQWYVNCDSMAKRACDAVRDGSLKILPAEHERTWFYWLENIRDWCVSRQLWWGHQIPAWFAYKKGEIGVDKNSMENNDRWIVSRTEEEALLKATELLKCGKDDVVLERDEDVLDTWFSSGLFPFSVFGWPDKTEDLDAFYPTSLLETGLDILFFWVARMVMMGLQLTDKLPFHTVYLHAMVRDKEGRKMSKSLGNVIDPLEVINGCSLDSLLKKLEAGNLPAKEVERSKKDQEADFPDGIPECGSDALRFGLLAYTVQGRDVNLDIKRVVGYRNFCNKLWNATKFALQFVTDFQPTSTLLDDLMASGKMAIRDKFIISRLMNTCEAVNENFKAYKFGDAQHASYSFWMDDLCNVYLELIKPVVYDNSEENADKKWAAQATLWTCLETGLRLLHPMLPFVSEELWQRLPGRGTLGQDEKESIMISEYPQCNDAYKNAEAEASMMTTLKVIKSCRSLRASYQITNKTQTKFYVKAIVDESVIKGQISDIITLGNASSVEVNIDESAIPQTVGIDVVDDQTTVFMDIKGLVDYDAEIKKLEKNLSKTMPALQNLEKKMQAKGYEENVKEDLKAQNAEKYEGLVKKVAEIHSAIENFRRLAELDKKFKNQNTYTQKKVKIVHKMDTADILDAALQSVPESQNSNRIASIDFSHDLEHRLGCANGNCYQRVPGIENVHDGQIMVRLKKKRFIVIDYSIAPNAAEIAAAQNDPHIQVPSGAGVQKCSTVNCNKVGIPICIFDSEPDEPASLYLRSGLCFTCQRALNEKRRTQKKRKSDVFDPLVINGTPLKDVKRHGKGYEYDEIIMDIEKNNTDLLKKTMDLSRMMIIYGQQGTLSEHCSEIEDLYQSTYVSVSKSMFLLNQWKLSFDDAMKDQSTNVAEPSNAVESAAGVVAAESKSMPPLPKVYEYDQKFKC